MNSITKKILSDAMLENQNNKLYKEVFENLYKNGSCWWGRTSEEEVSMEEYVINYLNDHNIKYSLDSYGLNLKIDTNNFDYSIILEELKLKYLNKPAFSIAFSTLIGKGGLWFGRHHETGIIFQQKMLNILDENLIDYQIEKNYLKLI